MTCRDFERMLGQPLNEEARVHMRTCESCRAVAQWFDAAPPVEIPAVPRAALKPVRPLPSPWILAAGIFVAGVIVLGVGTQRIGTQGWDAMHASQRFFIFAGLAASGVATSLLLANQMFPTMARRIDPPLCVAAALTAIAAGPLALMPFDYDPADFVELGLNCAQQGLLYAAAAAVPIWLVIRRGYFLRPGWAGALTGLASGLVAMTLLEVYCPIIESSHVLASHASVAACAVLISSALAYAAAKRAA